MLPTHLTWTFSSATVLYWVLIDIFSVRVNAAVARGGIWRRRSNSMWWWRGRGSGVDESRGGNDSFPPTRDCDFVHNPSPVQRSSDDIGFSAFALIPLSGGLER